MTDYQHPAEQGSTAEDFLGPRPTYPIYQYSVFLNGGRDEQLVVRASTFSELLEGKRNINKVLEKVNDQNKVAETNGARTNGTKFTNGNHVCEHINTKILTVQKNSPNKGRRFEACNDCREFLGFV